MATPQRTTRQVVDDTREHLSELVDAHVELAKAEMRRNQQELVAAVAPFVVAGVLGLYILGFFAVTGAKALTLVVDEWLAWLIVSVVLTLVAVVLGLVGKSRAEKLSMAPEEARTTVNETVAWAKTRVKQDG